MSNLLTPYAPVDRVPSLSILASAEPGSGKTHFSLTAPGPIAFLTFDRPSLDVLDKFAKQGKVIHRAAFDIPVGSGLNAGATKYKKAWDDFEETMLHAYQSGQYRTVVVDNIGGAWDLLRMNLFGKMDKVPARYYGPANARFNELIVEHNRHVGRGINTIMVARRDEVYGADGNPSGRTKASGWKHLPYETEVNVLLGHVAAEGPGDLGFRMQVEQCKTNPPVMGTVIGDTSKGFPPVNFQTLATMARPDVDPRHWT